MTKIGCILLTTSKKVCVTNLFHDLICNACDPCHAMCFFFFTVARIQGIHKITKTRNSEILNKMKGHTEDSTVQGSKDREMEMMSRKVSRKRYGIIQYVKLILVLLLKNLG